jgi:hypothetical protein
MRRMPPLPSAALVALSLGPSACSGGSDSTEMVE